MYLDLQSIAIEQAWQAALASSVCGATPPTFADIDRRMMVATRRPLPILRPARNKVEAEDRKLIGGYGLRL